eukprot:gene18680-20565_t
MGAEITFNKDECVVTKNGRKIRLGQVIDEKLYQVNATESANYSSVADEQTMQLWHCRYGHVNYDRNVLFCEDKFQNLESDTKVKEKDFVFFELQESSEKIETSDSYPLTDESVDDCEPVGATYEDNFIRQSLSQNRLKKP